MSGLRKILLLGGTAEAAALARRATDQFRDRATVITSLAGRTRAPAALPGEVRVGGFGGARGLHEYLASEGIALVIDATHPYAATIAEHAHDACLSAGVPRLKLLRPPWRLSPGAPWMEVPSLKRAAEILPRFSRRAFLAVGANSLAPFAKTEGVWFLVRVLEAPEIPPLPNAEMIVGRPPFSLTDEKALLERHGIDAVVAKNSGGDATRAKIDAALELGVRIVLIARPPPEPGETVAIVDAAMDWLAARL